MLQFAMEHNVLLYALTAFCAAGMLSQLILQQLYRRLIRETRNTGQPSGQFLTQLRQRFQYCTHLNEKVGNVQALIRKGLMEYRHWGMTLHQWNRIGVSCLVLCLLCAGIATVEMAKAGVQQLVLGNVYFEMGLFCIALTAAAYAVSDIRYREKQLIVGLTDYLENSGAVRDYGEARGAESCTDSAGSQAAARMDTQSCGVQTGSAASYGYAGQAGSTVEQGCAGQAESAVSHGYAGQAETAASHGYAGRSGSTAPQSSGTQSVRLRARTGSSAEPRVKKVSAKAQREKQALKESLAGIRAGIEESAAALEGTGTEEARFRKLDPRGEKAEILRRMDPQEQERILKEVLKEFLA